MSDSASRDELPRGRRRGTRTEPDAVRVYAAIRTAHLERFRVMVPAVVLYENTRYDFDTSVAPDDLVAHKVGRVSVLRALVRGNYRAVELTEPLMRRRWLDLLLQIGVIRLSDRVRRKHTRISSYCIGSTDPVAEMRNRRHVPEWAGRVISRVVLRRIVGSMDRLAFGTTTTFDLVASYTGARLLLPRAALFTALPEPYPGLNTADRDPHRILFVGAFDPRKGIRVLMKAWPGVVAKAPELRLAIIGTGQFQDEVIAWAADRPEVSLVLDPPRDDIHTAYMNAHVVVLPSQRRKHWREQVGLPIVEGLSHGCEIVTTDETGLASWLIQHGHQVVPMAESEARLPAAIVAAAAQTRTPTEITAALPTEDSRITADHWMLAENSYEVPGIGAQPASRPWAGGQALQYYQSTRRSMRINGTNPRRLVSRFDDRPLFVVGCPRSGTTFTAETIGKVSGFADLGELRPLKRVIPDLYGQPDDYVAKRIRDIIHLAQRVGLNAGMRGIEQTPESSYLITAIAQAFPEARFLHMVRDGRDVAASLIKLGWLGGVSDRNDVVGHAFGDQARFWVEVERRSDFIAGSAALRAGWAWRRYDTATRSALAQLPGRSLEVRYENLVAEPAATAKGIAEFLDASEKIDEFVEVYGETRSSARGRWRADLSPDELADVLREAGPHLAELGYGD